MINDLGIVCIIALILTVWFRSNAWLEYTRLFRLNFLSKYKEYDQAFLENPLLDYHTFLRKKYDNFFIRLIICPVCLSVWLGIVFGILTNIILFPIYSILGLILYLSINQLLQ